MSQVRSLNRVILVGRAGKDPEVTVMPNSGQQLAKFSLATNEGYFDKNNNAWKDLPTEWHNIVAWRALAQKVEKGVGKGDMVLVEGQHPHAQMEGQERPGQIEHRDPGRQYRRPGPPQGPGAPDSGTPYPPASATAPGFLSRQQANRAPRPSRPPRREMMPAYEEEDPF